MGRRRECYHAFDGGPNMAALLLDRLLETCYRRRAYDLLVAPGCAPLLRLASGWHPLQLSPPREEDIRSLVDEGMTGHELVTAEGYSFLDFTYGGDHFRMLAFGYPNTKFIMIMRRLPPAPPEHVFVRT